MSLQRIVRGLTCALALTLGFVSTAPAQTPLQSVRIASGFSRPIYVLSPTADYDRLFVVEQTGKIKIIKNGVTLGTPFLDLGPTGLNKAYTGPGIGERGLLGMAFHPQYAINGKFYVNYTDLAGSDTVVEEYTVSANPDIAAGGSAVTIFGPYFQPQVNHNGGCIQFGPDGMLYIGMGDGGNGNDTGTGHAPGGNAQAGTTLLGKILRLDVDIAAPYIPASNPFVGDPTMLDEVWSLGWRNPWRFSFDRATGDLYCGDVGQNAREEISYEPAGMGGLNHGWRCMEGFNCTGLSGCTCNAPSLTLPIQDYGHVQFGRCTVVGGYVYNGCAIPDLVGTYFYADYCDFRIWTLEYDGSTVSNFQQRTTELTPTVGTVTSITSWGEDAAGELYYTDLGGGEVYKIVPAASASAVYCTAGTSASGCTAKIASSGTPSASATSGFTLFANDVEGQKDGLFFFASNGRQANSWGSGTSFQCVTPPVMRAGILTGTGTAGTCSGVLSTDLAARWTAKPNQNPGAGAVVQAQLWYRDPQNTSNQTTSLSDAVEFVLCP